MGLRGFCFAAIDSRSGTPNILLGLNGMTQGPVLATPVFMGSVFLPSIPDLAPQTSRWGTTVVSGPSVGDMGLHGFCFAAIDSRSGTPNIRLGLNRMTLGPVLATRVFMGSVFLPSIPDLANESFYWGSTG